jgi:hypothetical protein
VCGLVTGFGTNVLSRGKETWHSRRLWQFFLSKHLIYIHYFPYLVGFGKSVGHMSTAGALWVDLWTFGFIPFCTGPTSSSFLLSNLLIRRKKAWNR